MKPIDYRNETWEKLQARLTGMRMEVLRLWQKHGASSTQDLAEKTGLSILLVRPRTTELYQLGLVTLVKDSEHGSGGIYQALSDDEARSRFEQLQEQHRSAAAAEQLTLRSAT